MYQYAILNTEQAKENILVFIDEKSDKHNINCIQDPEEPISIISEQCINGYLNKLGAEGWCMVARHENIIHLMRAVISPKTETTINKDIILCSDTDNDTDPKFFDNPPPNRNRDGSPNILDEPQPTKSKFMGS
jgi:hypothetical protein